MTKLKSPLVLGIVVVALLLGAGGTYLAITMINLINGQNNSKVSTKPKLVAPIKVQQSLKAANDVAMKEYDLHNSAAAALNEQQVKLAK